jgi:hypothetical protein
MGFQKVRTIGFWVSRRESYALHWLGAAEFYATDIRGKIVTYQEIGKF